MSDEFKNVVIYARFSSTKQKETSIEAQLKECHAFCKSNNYNVIGEYIDRALTARTDNRVNFLKMIEDSSKKKFEYIIVYQLDRFARNRYDSAIYKAKLKKNGVKVLSAKENITDDASGILVESMLEGMAEYYSVELGQKVKRNSTLNAEQGYFNGGYHPLGYKVVEVKLETYKKKKLEIDPITAPIVKEIYEMRANYTKIEDIVDYLNSKGYKTVQGKEFKKTSLDRILRNKRYIGIEKYGEKEFPNVLPRIIEDELFYKVQEVVDKFRYAPATTKAKEEYILTTKLFCGHCKEMMTGTCGTSATGNIYYYYICNGVKKKICKRKNVQKQYIEDIVINKCKELLDNKTIRMIAKKVYKICQEENSQSCLIKALEKEIKTIHKNIENLIIALENGQNVDLISDRLTQKRNELNIAEEKLEEEKSKLVNLTEEQIIYFLTQLKSKNNSNSIKYRKMLVNIFINRIYLYDDKLEIIFNVGEKKVTVDTKLADEIHTNFKKANSLFLNNLGQPAYSKSFRDLLFFILPLKSAIWGNFGEENLTTY